MKTTLRNSACAILLLGIAAAAHAQSGSATGAAQSTVRAGASSTTETRSTATVGTTATADPQADANLQKVRERTVKASKTTVAKAERKLTATMVKVNAQATAEEDQVAARLAQEFGMTTSAIQGEKERLETRWGDLMIAHTLKSSTATEISIDQLYQLKGEGNEWSRIASALGLAINDVVAAVNTEGRVAIGLEHSDGKVAVVHGPGARAGQTSATASTLR